VQITSLAAMPSTPSVSDAAPTVDFLDALYGLRKLSAVDRLLSRNAD